MGTLVFRTNEQKPRVSNPKILPPYTDLYMVVGNKSGQASKSQDFRLFVQNLRTSKILAVAPPMLKKVTVSDLCKSNFDIFELLNFNFQRVNSQYGGPQNSLQLIGLEEPLAAQKSVPQPTADEILGQQPHDMEEAYEENINDTTHTADENMGRRPEDIKEAYEENLNVKRTRKPPTRFKDFEMYSNVVLTSGIDLNKLSLYQRNVSKLDAIHRQRFYTGLSWHINFCKNNCPYDSLYKHLLKNPCKDQFAVYSFDNIKPRLKYKKKVTF